MKLVLFRIQTNDRSEELFYDSVNFLQQKYIEEMKFGATANLFTWKSVNNDVSFSMIPKIGC